MCVLLFLTQFLIQAIVCVSATERLTCNLMEMMPSSNSRSIDCGEYGLFSRRVNFDDDIDHENIITNQTAVFMSFVQDRVDGFNLDLNDTKRMTELVPINPRLSVIIHGFKTSTLRNFLKIKDGLFTLPAIHRPDVVIVVDWRDDSEIKSNWNFGYKDAAVNANVIGREVSYLLYLLKKHRSLDPLKVHLIGFSLGAQAAGYAARQAVLSYNFGSKIGRVTGLDPAGPRYEDYSGFLTKNDAIFVDIIHTNGGSLLSTKFGLAAAVGHVDFYPNGGSKQPGCTSSLKDLTCSHNKAHRYFEASLSSNCTFEARHCDSYDEYSKHKDPKCTPAAGYMGYYAFRTQARGKYYLETTREFPYCELDN